MELWMVLLEIIEVSKKMEARPRDFDKEGLK